MADKKSTKITFSRKVSSPEPGVHPATIVDVTPRSRGKGQKFMQWNFAVRIGRDVHRIPGFTPADPDTPKFQEWVEAALGRELDEGFELDLDELRGCEVWAEIVETERFKYKVQDIFRDDTQDNLDIEDEDVNEPDDLEEEVNLTGEDDDAPRSRPQPPWKK